jgi:hypothetical protein
MAANNQAQAIAPTSIVFCNASLVTAVLWHGFLVDGDDTARAALRFSDMAALRLVSRTFREAATTDMVWRPLCQRRWKTKWGFVFRLQRAEEAVLRTGRSWWKQARLEESDSLRGALRPDELSGMVWDFRFWVGQRLEVRSKICACACANLAYQVVLTPGGRP